MSTKDLATRGGLKRIINSVDAAQLALMRTIIRKYAPNLAWPVLAKRTQTDGDGASRDDALDVALHHVNRLQRKEACSPVARRHHPR